MQATAHRKVTFPRGGVHPPESKSTTRHLSLHRPPQPQILEVLMLQHIGAPATPIVKRREEVKKGQIIGEANGFISANVHSPVSGKVKSIENRTHNPTGGRVSAVVIENDGEDEWAEGCNVPGEMASMDPESMVSMVREAGVVGMGGAAFPAHVKLSPPQETPVSDVIINGAECEPMLTCDHRVMVENTAGIVEALRLIMRMVDAGRGYIAIEENKPDAIEAFQSVLAKDAAADGISLVGLEVKYPQGAEQQLITAVTGREVPAGGGLPSHVGCLVHNPSTALAMRDAIKYRRPLIERPVTVTGDALSDPGNFIELIGTSLDHILRRQGMTEDAGAIICGGPMMGVAQATAGVPLIKGNSGLVAFSSAEIAPQRACIRCGRCVENCPLGLMPNMISILCENEQWEPAGADYQVRECKECGCCAYVCPAKRRIVHMIKWCKAKLG